MQQLQQIYCQYTETLEKAKKEISPLAGLFGTGGGLNQHPCHKAFYDQVGQWVAEFLAAQPDPDSIAEATRFILVAGSAHKKLPTYWFICAVQAHSKPLIPMLPQDVCETLRQGYDALYPEASRLPLSQEIYDLLCRQAGFTPKKKGFFSFLRK